PKPPPWNDQPGIWSHSSERPSSGTGNRPCCGRILSSNRPLKTLGTGALEVPTLELTWKTGVRALVDSGRCLEPSPRIEKNQPSVMPSHEFGLQTKYPSLRFGGRGVWASPAQYQGSPLTG